MLTRRVFGRHGATVTRTGRTGRESRMGLSAMISYVGPALVNHKSTMERFDV